jgi:transcriptional regulator GlxA family with amidase domain
MASAAGLGRRQLERRFLAGVGVPPKMVSRIARFRHALELLRTEPTLRLSIVAMRAGYADQPHLTRDFVALAGVSPARYRREHVGR